MYSLILIVSLLPLFDTGASDNSLTCAIRLGSQRRPQKSSSPFRPAMSPRTQATAMADLVALASAHRHLLAKRCTLPAFFIFCAVRHPSTTFPTTGTQDSPSDAAVKESATVDAARHGRHAACTPPLIRFNHVEDDDSSDTPASCIRHRGRGQCPLEDADFARRTEPNARPIPSTTRSRPPRGVVGVDGLVTRTAVHRLRRRATYAPWPCLGDRRDIVSTARRLADGTRVTRRSLHRHLGGEMTAGVMIRSRCRHAHFPGCRAAGGMRAASRRTPSSLIPVACMGGWYENRYFPRGPTAGDTRAPPSAEGSECRRGSLLLLTVRTVPTLFFRRRGNLFWRVVAVSPARKVVKPVF
ncbi:uncharacterized protein SCHCODRAFT_02732652 [Schizophyllum commune H4-8]|uniref:uncharacterized protein n=1 Tax=Schizophyllum commune (strain H4-8 / FGSC 9210) TaxID=578458 RepID=UPI00215F58DF|nr:uncharacterized protein SCHCODRAFT_02732652 [Schizophyllum commune H4-8]KAI5892242.1 hypothetical protein SCHCODRAFT_02732652 [Schizophyllum commune H4-8]